MPCADSCCWAALPSCFRLFMHWLFRAASRADSTAGKSMATKMPMIAITTRSSTSVNPLGEQKRDRFDGLRRFTRHLRDLATRRVSRETTSCRSDLQGPRLFRGQHQNPRRRGGRGRAERNRVRPPTPPPIARRIPRSPGAGRMRGNPLGSIVALAAKSVKRKSSGRESLFAFTSAFAIMLPSRFLPLRLRVFA